MRVALVHEWLTTLGGSERVLMALHRLFPDAPVFTSVHDPARLPPEFAALDVRPSFLQKWPGARRHHQALLPFMPMAVEQHDLRGYDLVISSHHTCAKGVIVGADTLHISYVHTPMRYAWDLTFDYQDGLAAWQRMALMPLLTYLRAWDMAASLRVDHYVANSRLVAARIAKHYRRCATVIHPPVAVKDFTPVPGGPRTDAPFLVVSRLVPYKRIELAVRAANATGIPLEIIGDGPELRALRALAKPHVRFLGHLPDTAVRQALAACRALLFPGVEDFGLVPVEAMAAGRPVIAFGRGGATETIADGLSGIFFGEQTVESLVAAIRRFDTMAFDPVAIRRQAELFDESVFATRLQALVTSLYDQFKRGVPTAQFVLPSEEHLPAYGNGP